MRFLVESSAKFVLYSNDSVRTKRVCIATLGKFANRLKIFGLKKKVNCFIVLCR